MGLEPGGDTGGLADGEEAPTQLEVPRHSRAPHDTGGGSTSHGSSLLETDALRTERITRRRAALLMACVISGVAAVALQFSDVLTATHWVLTGLLAATALTCAGAWLSAKSERLSAILSSTTVGIVVALTALAGVAHTGAVSAVACALPLIVYYFAHDDSLRRAVGLFLLCALGYGLVAGLAATGALPLGESLVGIAISRGRARDVLVFAVVVEVILVGAFFMAQRSRRATLEAMERLEAAHRRIEQRDALLNEARADLDRAAEAGRFGRLTGSRVGSWLAGEVIGRGGMGEIYYATHTESSQPAALKVLHSWMLDQPEHVTRFFRESTVVSGLESPHIVKVFESGHADDGAPYLVMELLEGTDLARYLRQHKRMRIEDALELVTHVSRALAIAHEAGIVHRDLKPQNLFRTDPPEGEPARWKVLDFGVSKVREGAQTLTHGAAVGTPSYMSPEQARGHAVDGRSDVFSLGVVAYRALTGRPPFTAPDPVATMYQVMHVQPARPGDFLPGHEDVDLVLALALAKAPEQRFTTATAFAAALADAARGKLDVRFREAASGLLEREPWGAELSRR